MLRAFWRRIREFLKSKRKRAFQAKWDFSNTNVFDAKNIKSVALFRLDNKLGDSIMSGAFIKILQDFRPDIKITVISLDAAKTWFNFLDNINWITINKKNLKSIKTLIKHSGNFDAIVEIGNSPTHKNLVALSILKAKNYIGSDPSFKLFNVLLDVNKHKHFYERYMAAANLFLSTPVTTVNIPYPSFLSAKKELLQKIIEIETTKHIIAINLFGAGKHRQFSHDQALDLLNTWTQRAPDDLLILINVPGKEEFLANLVDNVNKQNVILSPLTVSIPNSLALIELADFTFTPDTSVVHMASVLNKPVLAIYMHDITKSHEWKPLGEGSEVIFLKKPKNNFHHSLINDFDINELFTKREKILKFVNKNKNI